MQKLFHRVVLVDDDYISNYLSSRILKRLDISNELVVLNDGKQALDFFKTQSVSENRPSKSMDLVLLDINMAELNGFELLEALRYTNYLENLKIIILSSSLNPKDFDKAAQYRMYGYLSKPLDVEKLTQILHSLPSPL